MGGRGRLESSHCSVALLLSWSWIGEWSSWWGSGRHDICRVTGRIARPVAGREALAAGEAWRLGGGRCRLAWG